MRPQDDPRLKRGLRGRLADEVRGEMIARCIELEAWKNPAGVATVAAEYGVSRQSIEKWFVKHPDWFGLGPKPEKPKPPIHMDDPPPAPTYEPLVAEPPPIVTEEVPEATLPTPGDAPMDPVFAKALSEGNLLFFVQTRDNPRVGWGDRLKAALAAHKIQSGLEDEKWSPPGGPLWAEAVRDAILELPQADRAAVADLLSKH